ncbi:vitamin K epoxide reductase family protein [Kineococcus rubinsiae]|uniref:vitamin K epoxide reductase family protein n=1 Tax=Kineococcus rubinsiae TaxID=2609562 RepID=UPI00142F526F|nr:vitamin K epoxide reductase family protein [Kineococcus rubinsiae]NIZ91426.1 vitamin K epoxide reductase family protein [Kineococcus rubinsiae]
MAGTTAAHDRGHDDGELADDDLFADDDLLDEDASREGHLSALPVSVRARGLLLTVGGLVGFVAAFTLTVERFKLAENPGYVPSCSINPVLSCGSVMKTDQAAVFGFPNPLMGIAAFTVMTLLGLLVLSGTRLPRWVERGFQVGITLGAVFVGWLVTQSLTSIHALCPYCMVVWAVVVATFWTTTADSLDRGLLPVPAGLRGAARTLVEFRVLAAVLTYALLVALIGVEFWSYWRTLL